MNTDIYCMSRYQTNGKLSIDVVRRVESSLADFDVERPLVFDQADADLECYLDTYGFSGMKANSLGHYVLGFLDLNTHRVATHYWQCDNAKATVFVAHGLFDHVGLYLDLVDCLVVAGYSVIALDFPGHGLSEGEPAVISDFAEYARVTKDALAVFVESSALPLYAVGQSTGGAAILNYVLETPQPLFTKLGLLAPLIRPKSWFWVSLSHALMHRFIRFVPRKFKPNCHRQEFNAFLDRFDPLQPRHISVEWIGAMKQWIAKFDHYPSSDIDTLLIQGTGDATVDWESNVPQIAGKFPRLSTVMVDDAGHHLVNEGDHWREQVFSNLTTFFDGESLP